jgi:glutathione-regulated potassium-efflux system protein KefB
VFGYQVLIDLGFTGDEARETIEEVRRRDDERFTLQLAGGLQAGRGLMRGNLTTPQPEPYIKPRREGRALNEEAAEALEDDEERQKTGV